MTFQPVGVGCGCHGPALALAYQAKLVWPGWLHVYNNHRGHTVVAVGHRCTASLTVRAEQLGQRVVHLDEHLAHSLG
jgi:hypothetical protein